MRGLSPRHVPDSSCHRRQARGKIPVPDESRAQEEVVRDAGGWRLESGRLVPVRNAEDSLRAKAGLRGRAADAEDRMARHHQYGGSELTAKLQRSNHRVRQGHDDNDDEDEDNPLYLRT